MRTSARNVTLVLFDEVEALDFAAVLQVLTQAGRHWNWRPFKIDTVGAARGAIRSVSQLGIAVDHDRDGCPEGELLVIPGGYGARRAADDARWVDFARERGSRAELVLTLGWGALLAARAGLADGLEIAAPKEAAAAMAEAAPGARVLTDVRAHSADKLVSGQSGAASLDVGLLALSRVLGEKQALAVAQALGHEWSGSAPERFRIDILPP
ncbi:MAG: DJ-1/PfpI family protein [Myxococcales bacterium]|nr:DJ-1/PfpI family protein [Myxococcales bacterium]